MTDTTTLDAIVTDPGAMIEIKGLNKWFGVLHVLRDIDLTVARREKIVICGPSGSGKSTLIRCINRLEHHQQGSIVVDGTELSNDLKNIDAIRREVGMVFQSFNLFPHLTVLENCGLAPIWVRKIPKVEADRTAMEYLVDAVGRGRPIHRAMTRRATPHGGTKAPRHQGTKASGRERRRRGDVRQRDPLVL